MGSLVPVHRDVDLAHRQPALYGLAAIVLAVGAGWGASVMFRRR